MIGEEKSMIFGIEIELQTNCLIFKSYFMIIFRKLFSKLINDDRLFTENRQDEIKYLIKCSKTTTMEFLKSLRDILL